MKPQEGRNISEFEYGDIITRVIPCFYGFKDDSEMGEDGIIVKQKVEDFSYKGEPLKLIGIANNMIYVEFVNPFCNIKNTQLPIERWAEGWDIWIDPYKMFGNQEN